MIFQGLFNIIDLYFKDIYLFYSNLENYFRKSLYDYTEGKNEINNLEKNLEDLIELYRKELIKFGFQKEEIELCYLNQIREIKYDNANPIRNINDLHNALIPILYEFFLEKIFDYFINDEVASNIMLKLREYELLPISFIMELRSLKRLFERSPEKVDNLRKYLNIRDKIVKKLRDNKIKIEKVNGLNDPRDKLQLFYMIYQIIDFFDVHDLFNFKEIKEYIKNDMNKWLDTIPLVSLKNPDLYYCGIYLALELNIEIDFDSVKYFLLRIYDELIDEFEAPIIEATNQVYFFFKGSWLVDLELSDGQIKELLKGDKDFFSSRNLQNLETSELVIILKIYNMLGLYEKEDPQKINNIFDEIRERITDSGIIQYRNGFLSSEATYYVFFCYYMRNSMRELKDYNFLERIISRIYRNLEILAISEETNYDLVSELFYSVEILRLLNCIETKSVILHLAKHLFPEQVVEKVLSIDDIVSDTAKFRHIYVSKQNGEKIC
ncbi:MAG: hypothetical protein GF317_15300 [Candidatus Lokiarchaeota archaeon]|nr:hypothetical protein [Candidatus Lokiarchaeota archaeon]MBD3200937.1 hypothetical protein [Candidatus Lokiarchaeota archaeon]